MGEARKTLLDDAAALAAFERAVQLAPNDAVAQYRLGAAYLDNDKPHDALPHLEQAYRLTSGGSIYPERFAEGVEAGGPEPGSGRDQAETS